MAELSSLYMRVTLTEKNLIAFKQSPALAPRQYQDWLPWLATQSYYGDITDQEIQAMEPSDHSPITVDDYLSEVVESEGILFSGAVRSNYNQTSNTWTLFVMEFGENYGDFIQELSILRAIERYKDLPGEDFILIYPFLYGDGPDTYLVIEQGASHFENEAPESAVAEAKLAFDQLLEELDPNN